MWWKILLILRIIFSKKYEFQTHSKTCYIYLLRTSVTMRKIIFLASTFVTMRHIFLDIMNPKWTLTDQRCSLATGCEIIYRIRNLCVVPYFVKGSRCPAGCGGYVQDFFWYVLYQVGEPINSWKTHGCILCIMPTGPRLNIKTVLSRYGDFHVKDKTAVRTSYL